MSDYYPCPPCFISGRIRTGIIKKGEYGSMWFVEERNNGICKYLCKCGAVLLTKERRTEKDE